jgi:hypothetical protein
MPYRWPADTDFAPLELDVLDRDCPACGRMMSIRDHRYRRFHTLDGPVELVCKLNHCADRNRPGHARTTSPELEITLALPRWAIGRDVFGWIGQQWFSRHWSITPIPIELLDAYGIKLSADSLADHIQRHQVMLAARQQDPDWPRRQYESVNEIILRNDGLQPEKGHQALSVVRELTQMCVRFAESLMSATDAEVRRLIAQARQWAASLGKTVVLWVSDKQNTLVTGVAAEFPGVPHRYCENHFLRNVAKPVLEINRHTKVQTRKKVRGLREIEQAVLKHERASTDQDPTPDDPESTLTVSTESVPSKATRTPSPSPSNDLLPHRAGRAPASRTEAVNRRKIMRKARSKKTRPFSLAGLQRRYRKSPIF